MGHNAAPRVRKIEKIPVISSGMEPMPFWLVV
jgi:hypothetical protein